MEKRLVQAEKIIADLKAEVNVLQSARADGQQDENQPQQQEQQDRNSSRVSTHNLAKIHGRKEKVAQALREYPCSRVHGAAFQLSSCPRSTVRDFVLLQNLRNKIY